MQTVQHVIDYMKGKGIDVCCHVEGSNNIIMTNHVEVVFRWLHIEAEK